ncbi:MAG: Crp/Fnr family transcriptional regulator [Bacteroidales bacterium]|nr:Crp/Fnr family transcriptional regulator [Bacteroidales bacterium]
MFDILINCPLFKGLNEHELPALFNKIPFQKKRFRKDEILVFTGDEIINQLILLEGSVKGEMPDPSGKTIKIEDIESPRPLAPAFLFGKQNFYPVNLVANNDVQVLSIPKDSFIKLLQLNEKILRNYLDIVSNKAQFLSNKIRFLSFQSLKEKFIRYILELSRTTESNEITLPKTQTELAEMFGVARPSLARAISELNEKKLILTQGKTIQIIDKPQLISALKK